jgi:fatty-acyl-CoA synthase
MNLSHWIERWAGFSADKPALRYEGAEIGYAALARRIALIAGGLADTFGVRRGDRVAWLGLNNAESIALLFACARLGVIFIPLNWRLAPAEHLALMADAEPVLLLVEPEFAAAIEAKAVVIAGPILACTGGPRPGWLDWQAAIDAATAKTDGEGRADDPVLLCYTSGTTGVPKGAIHTQDGMVWNAINSTHMHDLTSHDRVLTTLPIFHVGGLNIQTMPALHAGATVSLHRRFDPAAVLAALVADRITLTVLVPTQLTLIMADPAWASADLTRLRTITTGSTTVPPDLIQAVRERGVPMIQIYGSTETGPVAVFQRSDASGRIGSAGHCAIHNEMRIVDIFGTDVAAGESGEILIRGRNVMTGYWRDEATTRAALVDGWFHTGDIGHLDEDGSLVVDDRKKDMIISGGENIFPAALEAILNESADIAECAVVGRADDRWGEVPIAVVVPRPGARLRSEDVLALFRDRLARYKHPRAVLFVEELPRTSIGKVAKSEIRKLARQMPWPPSS